MRNVLGRLTRRQKPDSGDSPTVQRWRDPTVGRMIPTRIGQVAVAAAALIAVAGGARALLTDSPAVVAEQAASSAVARYEAEAGSPGIANALLAETARDYFARWWAGSGGTEHLTASGDNHTHRGDAADSTAVPHVRVTRIQAASAAVAAGALYQVTVAVTDPTGDADPSWFRVPMVVSGNRTLIAAAPRPVDPPDPQPVDVWAVDWDDAADPQLLEDLAGFLAAWQGDADRLDLWTTADSELVPLGYLADAGPISVLRVGTVPAADGTVTVRVYASAGGRVYEWTVRAVLLGGRWVVSSVSPVPPPLLPTPTAP